MRIIHHSGKRKQAIAKATLKNGSGKVRINSQSIDVYEPEALRLRLREPLILAGKMADEVDITIKTSGGGISSQTEAARLSIARCLVDYNKKLEKAFLSYDRHLLVGDIRRKEPCKPNDSKARKKRQKSYR